jgi:cytosine/adenosine deaminase-related metal-dependent hydrolase
VRARDLLRSATDVGARALGFDDRGSLEVGKRPAIIAVPIRDDVRDVEEYLVGGAVDAGSIEWIAEAP